MRKCAVFALMISAVVVPVVNVGAPKVAAAVPTGFTDVQVAVPGGSTGIAGLPDGRVLVLVQSGSVRLIRNDVLVPGASLTLGLAPCNDGEQGLLGAAVDPNFTVNGVLYLYYTRPSAGSPGGCLNRISRFTMSGDVIDPASEVILVDNISARNGNHNGGDLEIGGDGFLYVSIGDAGTDPRVRSGVNTAAQDLSLLNGKILRVVPSTGEPAPGNPLSGPGTESCRVRGNLPATPTTSCQELYAWGLRNPFRFAFDPNTGPDRFFINDVGLNKREEVDEGGIGRNYGWSVREGVCAYNQDPPCTAADPAAGFTEPLTDYPHSVGSVITAAAFIPNGHWPAEYDGGYLFADAGSGNMWLRPANGSVDYSAPFATGVGGIADMAFVTTTTSIALYYTTTGGSVHKITRPPTTFVDPGPLAFVSVPPGTRVLDTREPVAGSKVVRANTTRYVPMSVDPAVTKAVLVNFAFVTPSTAGYLTAWSGRTARPLASNVNAVAGEYVANSAIVPVDANGGILVYSQSTADVVIDVLGYFNVAPAEVRAGRFVAVPPTRIGDTRAATSATNQYIRGVGSELPYVRVPVGDRGGLPAVASMSAAVLVVTAVSSATDAPGFLSASAGGAPYSHISHLNTNGAGDQRPNLVVVPVAADGTVDLHLFSIADVVVDVAGYFTSASAPNATAGRFHVIEPFREVDTRGGVGFGRLPGGAGATIDPSTVPANAGAMAHTITIVDNAAPGYVTPYPGPAVPFVSAGNTTAAGQIHAVLSFTQLSAAPARMSYYTFMPTDLVVDTPGY
ncbi:MAG: PQQ-dependent sugar dehydrogenase, partial [Ilumatobacteraceae bacterium]